MVLRHGDINGLRCAGRRIEACEFLIPLVDFSPSHPLLLAKLHPGDLRSVDIDFFTETGHGLLCELHAEVSTHYLS